MAKKIKEITKPSEWRVILNEQDAVDLAVALQFALETHTERSPINLLGRLERLRWWHRQFQDMRS